MKFIITASARKELTDSIDFYNKKRPGLGFEFADSVKKGLSRIGEVPESWPKFSKRLRRFLLKKFPFAIIYYSDITNTQITIIAIMHLHRKPVHWKNQ